MTTEQHIGIILLILIFGFISIVWSWAVDPDPEKPTFRELLEGATVFTIGLILLLEVIFWIFYFLHKYL